MTTIPASQIANVVPSVLGAIGNELEVIGLVVTQNTRVPIGTVASFPLPAAVSTFFGPTAHETAMANTYFSGFINASAVPEAMLFTQMPCTAVGAYLRGGNISTLPIPQLQGISGLLTVVVDGYTRSASISLAAATSFSAAANTIATSLNAGLSNVANATTGSIGPQTASFTGSIQGNVLTVTQVAGGVIVTGGLMGTAGGVAANTLITGQLTQTGTVPGSLGTYAVSIAQAVTNTAMTETYGLLNITVMGTGSFSVGQTISGTGVTVGTQITQLGTAAGTVGTYYVNFTQTVGGVAINGQPTPVTCTFDSVSGGLILSSGITGPASTIAFATGGAATLIAWTAATSAVISQGAAPVTPGAFMTSVDAITQNWATFMTAFDPDFGVAGGAQKLLFSQWTSQAQENQDFAFITWDTDPSPTITVPATGSYGYALQQGNYSGTCLIWQPTDQLLEAFVSGVGASINFSQQNGRITFAFKSQAGLTASVTNATVAQNLIANGYNFYGAYATAAQQFIFFYPGSVTGPFRWLDSYINQIWLTAQFQLALMELLTQVYSIPYNPAGYALIEAGCSDVILAAGNFGAYRAGVTLSQAEQAEVNSQAGVNIATVLNQRGWYLQINDPGVAVREARGSPQCTFWYMDGQAVQQITLNSIDIL